MRVLDFSATSAIGLNHLLPSTADVYQVGTRLCLAVMNPLMIAVESILACPPVPPPQLHVTSILKYNTLSWGWGARLAGNFASGSARRIYIIYPRYFSKPELVQCTYVQATVYVLLPVISVIWVSPTDRLWRPLTSRLHVPLARCLLRN